MAAIAVCLAGACDRGNGGPTGAEASRPLVYVAVGASESVGAGADDPGTQAWTAVFHRTALPPGSTFVNLGVSGSTTAQALAEQVPPALQRAPDIVTVWLNVNDIIDRVPAERYEEQLGELVRRLRRDGESEVLVANTPEIDQLPVVTRLGPLVTAAADRSVDEYNAATARVVKEHDAVLVDLHAASERAEAEGRYASLVSADGFHPSTAGHADVASHFADAYRRSR